MGTAEILGYLLSPSGGLAHVEFSSERGSEGRRTGSTGNTGRRPKVVPTTDRDRGPGTGDP